MFSRKLSLIFLMHILTAYVVGSQIYGFHGEPNKFIVVGLAVALIVLAYYAKENMVAGTRDAILQAFQIVFALGSGGLGYSRDYMVIAMSLLLLSLAVIICYVRVKVMQTNGTT